MKGCGNRYYGFFDERAYPCSLCIRGIKRTDKWMPSKKTKAEIQQVVRLKHFKCPKCGRSDYIRSFEDWGIDGGIYKYKCINCNTYIKDEPQTDPKTNATRCPHCGIGVIVNDINICPWCGKPITDEPQVRLCRECDDYAGDGMFCAKNYMVFDFSISIDKCEAEPQTDCT